MAQYLKTLKEYEELVAIDIKVTDRPTDRPTTRPTEALHDILSYLILSYLIIQFDRDKCLLTLFPSKFVLFITQSTTTSLSLSLSLSLTLTKLYYTPPF